MSPTAATEALHQEVLLAEPERQPASASAVPERWDPLVQRARAELASHRLRRRPARRRGGRAAGRGAGALGGGRLGGVLRPRLPDAALRLAEQAAPRGAATTSGGPAASPLAGRARHSRGDLAGADRRPRGCGQQHGTGVRGTGEVWLEQRCACTRVGSAEAHRARPARGAVDAAALRHPFVIPHAMFARVLRPRGARVASPRPSTRWSARTRSSTSSVRPVSASVPWSTTSGRGSSAPSVAPTRPHERAAGRAWTEGGPASPSRGTTRCSTWRWRPSSVEDAADGDRVAGPGGGAAGRRRRDGLAPAPAKRLLEGRVGLLEGDRARGRWSLAEWVRGRRRRRGCSRVRRSRPTCSPTWRTPPGVSPTMWRSARDVEALDRSARLEGWRLGARVVVATGTTTCGRRSTVSSGACSTAAAPTLAAPSEWIDATLTRLGR